MTKNAPAISPIRDARMEDAGEIADILAEAFDNDPVMRWTFGHSVSLTPIFRALATGVYLRRGFGHIVDNAAVTLWLPAGEKNKPPIGTELSIVFSLLSGGIRTIGRAIEVDKVLAANHPHAPHYYLFAVGVRRPARGKGLGGNLIREGLKKADTDNIQVYLENSNPLNTPLYERLGFQAMSPLPLPVAAPPLLGMLRSPGKAMA